MKMVSIAQELSSNTYPGRGIILGRTPVGKKAAIAYFIMGRSVNSRNRVFVTDGDGIRTQAHDPALHSDPSLVIYAPVRVLGSSTIVTNGDQTDTIYDMMSQGRTFEDALRTRSFESDAPNDPPLISGLVAKDGSYRLSILKSNNGNGASAQRFFYEYSQPVAGEGHFIHTYRCDGDPIPSYEGEPTLVEIPDLALDAFTQLVWENLNPDNKVSLFTRYIDLETGAAESRIVNKNC